MSTTSKTPAEQATTIRAIMVPAQAAARRQQLAAEKKLKGMFMATSFKQLGLTKYL